MPNAAFACHAHAMPNAPHLTHTHKTLTPSLHHPHTKQDARGSCPGCFSRRRCQPGRARFIITCPPAQLLLASTLAPCFLAATATMTADPEPVVLTVLLALATFYLLRYVRWGGKGSPCLCRPCAVGHDDAEACLSLHTATSLFSPHQTEGDVSIRAVGGVTYHHEHVSDFFSYSVVSHSHHTPMTYPRLTPLRPPLLPPYSRYYRSPDVSFSITLLIYVSWFLGFAGVFLLPFDLGDVQVRACVCVCVCVCVLIGWFNGV